MGLYSLIASYKTGRLFNDNLCFFRCLALHRGAKIQALETPTKLLFREFCDKYPMSPPDFRGITLGQIHELSTMFDVGVNVYKLKESGETELLLRTIKQDNVMALNLFNDHFSLIKDFDKYSVCYICQKCKKKF